MQPLRKRDIIYWSVLYFLPVLFIAFVSISIAYQLSNFTTLFLVYLLLYFLSLVFRKKIIPLFRITLSRLLLTPFISLIVHFVVSFVASFISPFGLEFILQGSYQTPPSDWFSFGGGYGSCPDLSDCLPITKEEFFLYIIIIQLLSYVLAIFAGRLLSKMKAHNWQSLRKNSGKLLLALLLTLFPLITDLFIALRTHTLSDFEYKYNLNGDLLSGIIANLFTTLVPFLIFFFLFLIEAMLSKRLGFFNAKNNRQHRAGWKTFILFLLFLVVTLAIAATGYFFDYAITFNGIQ